MPNRAPGPRATCLKGEIHLGASAASLARLLEKGKLAKELYDHGKTLKAMVRVGRLAARYGPDTRVAAMGKNFLRSASHLSAGGIARDIAFGGVIGGLESAGRNIERKDISSADKAGRIAFGAGKGVVKGAAQTAGGALLGAGIGAVLGSVIPGPGTAAGAVLGAKLGAMYLGSVAGLVTDGWIDKLLPDRYEQNVGRFADQVAKKAGKIAESAAKEVRQISAGVKGALLGAAHLFGGWHF